MLPLLSDVSSPEWQFLTQGGMTGLLAAVVVAFWTGRLVPGSSLERQRQESEEREEQLRQERDRALEQVYKQAEIAQRALEALERKTIA